MTESVSPSRADELSTRINTSFATGNILPLYLGGREGRADRQYVRELGECKRFLERWTGDEAFRVRAATDPAGAAQSIGLTIDVLPLQPLWDDAASMRTPVAELPLLLLRYRAFIGEKLTLRDHLRRTDATMDARWRRWRERQMWRTQNELHPAQAESIVHAPYCIELCNGCSVGCWFCGIAAPKLDDIFRRTPANAALFDGAVETMNELAGGASGRGFLYWATDPMDNPDYEAFMVDFHARTGAFPQTTTALALKDVPRTRALLQLALAKGGFVDRFSLLSLRQLERVHKEFTPEELIDVELVLQNKENISGKANAGRAEERKPRRTATPSSSSHGDDLFPGTIACVSGFLFNMATRTVKLISPCVASERWPLGYIVFAERHFDDAAEVRAGVYEMVDEQMSLSLRPDEPVAFYKSFQYEARDAGFQLRNANTAVEFELNPVFGAIGRVLRDAHPAARTVEEVIDAVTKEGEIGIAEALFALQQIHERGVLDTLPRGGDAAELVQLRL